MITTDLAARGIDITQLPLVVNYDLPRSATDYVHRIGRTGRAGEDGTAISFVTPADQAHWALICKRNQLDLELEQLPGFEPTEPVPPPPVAQDGNGGIKGRRPSKRQAACRGRRSSQDRKRTERFRFSPRRRARQSDPGTPPG